MYRRITHASFCPLPQGASFSLQVKDHAAWGVSLQSSSNRPGIDPFVFALAATTVACNEMLHDGAGRIRQGGISVSGLPPPVPPSQVRCTQFFFSVFLWRYVVILCCAFSGVFYGCVNQARCV